MQKAGYDRKQLEKILHQMTAYSKMGSFYLFYRLV